MRVKGVKEYLMYHIEENVLWSIYCIFPSFDIFISVLTNSVEAKNI